MPWKASSFSLLNTTQQITGLNQADIAASVIYSAGGRAVPVNTPAQLASTGPNPQYDSSVLAPASLNIEAALLINQTASQLTRFPSA